MQTEAKGMRYQRAAFPSLSILDPHDAARFWKRLYRFGFNLADGAEMNASIPCKR